MRTSNASTTTAARSVGRCHRLTTADECLAEDADRADEEDVVDRVDRVDRVEEAFSSVIL